MLVVNLGPPQTYGRRRKRPVILRISFCFLFVRFPFILRPAPATTDSPPRPSPLRGRTSRRTPSPTAPATATYSRCCGTPYSSPLPRQSRSATTSCPSYRMNGSNFTQHCCLSDMLRRFENGAARPRTGPDIPAPSPCSIRTPVYPPTAAPRPIRTYASPATDGFRASCFSSGFPSIYTSTTFLLSWRIKPPSALCGMLFRLQNA